MSKNITGNQPATSLIQLITGDR